MFSALQYGAIGLAAIMFVVVVRLLQAEQKHKDIRPEFLRGVYVAMGLGVVLMLVAVGADLFKNIYAAAPLEKKLATLEAELSTKTRLVNDLTIKLSEADALKAQIKGEVTGFSMIEDVKIAYILGDSLPKGAAKDTLLAMVRSICGGSQNLKAILGLPSNSRACADVERAIQGL
jgi:hypothetical protein